jgi:hypothetical protein
MQTKRLSLARFNPWLLSWGLGLVSFALVTLVVYRYGPEPVDWETFRTAALALITGQSPYADPAFYNPPWLLLPIAPLALLPPKLGGALMSVAGLAAYGFVAQRLGARPLVLLAIVLSPPVLFDTLTCANLGGLVVLGLLLPPRWGLFLVLAKPQIGIGLALYWAVEAWRKGGWRQVVRTFAPVAAAFGLSLLLYGPWPLKAGAVVAQVWNVSLWPYGLAIGLPLLVTAIRRRQSGLALAASPVLSPYIALHGWAAVLLGLLPRQAETLAAVAGLWLAAFITVL